jgi:polygalacturonase
LSAHLFEDKSCDVNLEIKVQVLLDIEKTISEGNVASEIVEVEGLILIAMNRQKDNIQKTKNKTLEQIMEEENKKNKKMKNFFY